LNWSEDILNVPLDIAGGATGNQLYYQSWLPEQDPKAILIIAHGLAEHGGRYHHVANYFVKRNYGVYALDHVGHGKSQGQRCYIDHFSQYTDGLNALTQYVLTSHADVPRFLIGHSMGGLIITSFLLDNQALFHGSVLSAAAIKMSKPPSHFELWINRLLSKWFPRLGILKLDAQGISRDPKEVQKYIEDPLVFSGKVSARLIFELLATMDKTLSKMSTLNLPLLILHGSDDQLTSVEGSRILYETVSSTDKTLTLYEGCYHEIFNEPEQEKVFADMTAWLDCRLLASN